MQKRVLKMFCLAFMGLITSLNAGTLKERFEETYRFERGGTLILSNTNGSIKTDFPIEVRGEISRRRLRGTINGGGGEIELHTTNGSIKILER